MRLVKKEEVVDQKNYIVVLEKGEMKFLKACLGKHPNGSLSIDFYGREFGWGDSVVCTDFDVEYIMELDI